MFLASPSMFQERAQNVLNFELVFKSQSEVSASSADLSKASTSTFSVELLEASTSTVDLSKAASLKRPEGLGYHHS